MRKRSFYNSTSLLITILLFTLADCTQKKTEEPPDNIAKESPEEVLSIDYVTMEDKSSLDKLYELAHMKEWYPVRIAPPAFDYTIDISMKSVTELWLLRNEIFARNGYLFDEAILRGYFSQYKWYQPVFDVPEFKVPLNQQEQDFVNKVVARESELKTLRYTKQNGLPMLHMDHVYNLVQFKTVPQALLDQLARTNFAIVPAQHEQLFHVYDENHYQYIPSFISTDIYLQVLHKHFSSILRKIEEDNFIPLLTTLLKSLYNESVNIQQDARHEKLQQTTNWTTVYLAIAFTLLTDESLPVPDLAEATYKTELERIRHAEGFGSEFLQSDLLQYSQFKPRGNYTKTQELENYFRCMKWLNTAPIFIDDEEGLLRSALLASLIKRSPSHLKAFSKFSEAILFVVGEEDNLSLTHVVNVLSTDDVNDPVSLVDSKKLNTLRMKLEAVDPNRIKPQVASVLAQEALRPTVLFTAGRYTFDAEILSRLVHTLQPTPKRPFPKGLDVFAAFGSQEAENILVNDYGEVQNWSAYPTELAKLKQQFGQYDAWNKNIYSKTMEVIHSIQSSDERHPMFMKTPSWERKNLITSLAAWTELKHDMLLYSEQPYAAQAGEGGGPPPPQHIGYVEPNISFWRKALELIDLQEKTLRTQDLLSGDIKVINDELKKIGNFLLAVSEKELNGVPLNAKEFDEISWLGGRIEHLTFRIYESDHLPEKDRLVALVADVYRNNNDYLEEAVGLVDELYVVVEINGKPYLTRGTVFSYYEFTNTQPLTDEEWQKLLLEGNAPPRPKWTNSIMVKTQSLQAREEYSLLGSSYYY